MQRRDFIKTTSLGALALSSNMDLNLGMDKPAIVSLQLYSVREDMNKDAAGTIKALAKMGYKDCEHAGYNAQTRQFYKYSPMDWKKLLADQGMTMGSGHTQFGAQHYNMETKQLSDLWKTTVEDAITAGQKFIISPWLDINLRKNLDDLKKFLNGFNVAGEYCKSQGIRYGYHNHDFEFSSRLGDKQVMDHIMDNTDSTLVAQQIDIGNMYNGGGKALDVLKKYPGRFELMHVKDEVKSSKPGNEKYESAILGTGIIGVKDVIKYARKKGGTYYLIIEQESYQGMAPLDSMKKDLEVMAMWGYK